jgi:hypothetical protein
MTALDARASHAKPWLVLVRAGAIGATALAADVAFDPQQRHVPLCPFHAVTGLWCPLCGSLRAANSLAHGHIGTAVRDNVLLVASVVLAAVWAVDYVLRSRRGAAPRVLTRPAVFGLIALLTVFTIVRNLPFGSAFAP